MGSTHFSVGLSRSTAETSGSRTSSGRHPTSYEAHDPRTLVIVLRGADAGLRSGEIVALEWTDVDLTRGQLKVQRSDSGFALMRRV